MNKLSLILCILIFIACGNNKQQEIYSQLKEIINSNNIHDTTFIRKLAVEYDSVHTLIRDGKINKGLAQNELQNRLPILKEIYYNIKNDTLKQMDFIFPLLGYNSKSIGGAHGEGYIVGNYDYFKGNNYQGHPAQDVFIHDKNQDCQDDQTNKPVIILSVSNGIVIALFDKWDTLSNIKGGNYIWIYDIVNNSFFYYAHCDKLLVKLGQIVKAGDLIATVGRTGLNAYKKRSPTHLHFMKLIIDENFYPKPTNTYQDLLKAQIKL